MSDDSFLKSPRSRFRAAMVLAIVADAVQILIFPLFAEGAISPLDDILDLTVMAALIPLIGWHWEFLPSFIAELVPGLDLVPFWTLAVVNVYRKWKRVEDAAQKVAGPDGAAAKLEIPRSTLESRIKQLNIKSTPSDKSLG